jgi:hypothetical protein
MPTGYVILTVCTDNLGRETCQHSQKIFRTEEAAEKAMSPVRVDPWLASVRQEIVPVRTYWPEEAAAEPLLGEAA